MLKQKAFRVPEEVEQKFQELKKVYQARSENHLWELIVNDIYEIKKAKALVPYEELDKRDKELKMAYMKLGEFQGILQEKQVTLREKEERLRDEKEQREKLLQELETLKTELKELKEKTEKKKGFWARLFGR